MVMYCVNVVGVVVLTYVARFYAVFPIVWGDSGPFLWPEREDFYDVFL